jgi:hypothetical protein
MTTATPTLDDLVGSSHEQISLLSATSAFKVAGQADLRDEVIRQKLSRTAALICGAAALGDIKEFACLGILGVFA